jgi:hypothetical protein
VDSTGINTEGEGEWTARKHGGPKRSLWRKIYIGIDEQTLEIRAIEVTSSNVGDAPILPDLIGQIAPEQGIGSVTADGAYDTRKYHDTIAARKTHANILPRKNAKRWKPDTAVARARNEATLGHCTKGDVWRVLQIDVHFVSLFHGFCRDRGSDRQQVHNNRTQTAVGHEMRDEPGEDAARLCVD